MVVGAVDSRYGISADVDCSFRVRNRKIDRDFLTPGSVSPKHNSEFATLALRGFVVKFKHRSTSPLAKKARRGFRGYPVATIAFYGPDNKRASKVAVGIIRAEGADPEMTRLFDDEGDIRRNPEIGNRYPLER